MLFCDIHLFGCLGVCVSLRKRLLVLSTSGCSSMLESIASVFGQKQVSGTDDICQGFNRIFSGGN